MKPINVDKLRTNLNERFFEALSRRRIDIKEAAYYAGCNEKVLARLRRGESEKIDLAYVVAIARSLPAPESFAFLEDVTGLQPDVSGADLRIQDAMLQLAPAAANSGWWYLPDGAKLHASPDPASALRTACVLPGATDAINHGLATIGAVLREGVRVRFDAETVAPKAAISCARHLRDRFGLETTVFINHETYALGNGVKLLEEAAATSAVRISKSIRPWSVKRLPIDAIEDELLARFANEVSARINDVASYAMRGGMADRCALFNVDGGNVTSLWAGNSLLVNRDDVIGRNVMDREDIAYASMIREHVFEACEENIVYREMDVPLNGLRGRWRRVAAAGRRSDSGMRQVVTLVQVIGLTPYD